MPSFVGLLGQRPYLLELLDPRTNAREDQRVRVEIDPRDVVVAEPSVPEENSAGASSSPRGGPALRRRAKLGGRCPGSHRDGGVLPVAGVVDEGATAGRVFDVFDLPRTR